MRTPRTLAVTALAAAALGMAGCTSHATAGAGPAPVASSPDTAAAGTAPATRPTATAPVTVETNPPGDIPDNTVYVIYQPPGGGYEIKVPEGWARTNSGGATTFTDKLNSVTVQAQPATAAPTVPSARADDVPTIVASADHFALKDVTATTRSAGPVVLIVYEAYSPADPVTNKVVLDRVERYEFFHAGQRLILTLSGPVGADNVDPWRTVSDSVRWLA